MADFSTIKGFEIQSLASDPIISLAASGTWASGGAMPTATNNMASFGTQTAAMSAGGYYPTGLTAISFTYDGTSWSPIQALQESPTKYGRRGCGTTAAGLVFGGIPPVSTATEEWGGSSWTAGGSLSTARYNLGAAGTQTAGLAFGGNQDPPPVSSACEEYNGTSWSAGGSLSTARNGLAGVGIQTLALAIGGSTGSDTAAVEQYNGSSWSAGGDLNTARNNLSSARNGVVGSALAFGGHDSAATGKTESYDGTTWTEVSDLATARGDLGGAGVLTAAVAFGGEEPSRSTATEEFTTASPPLSLVQEGQVWFNSTSNVLKGYGLSAPAGTWASSPSLNTGRAYSGSAGNAPDSAMVFGGETPSATGATETYDGSGWTTSPATLNTPRTYIMSFGVTTASMCVGGTPPQTAASETWDGTSWAEGYDLNSARHSGGGAGVTTAGLVFGGGVWNQPSLHKLTEEYDGSCWAEKADLNNDHMTNINSLGLTQTAAICSSGYRFPSPAATAFTEEWNGSSWTEIADLNTARYYAGGSGSVTSGLIMGGEVPAPTFYSKVELYNGTAWTEIADMGTARAHFPGTTTNGPSSGVVIAGGGPGFQTSAETFAAGTAIKTFTGS